MLWFFHFTCLTMPFSHWKDNRNFSLTRSIECKTFLHWLFRCHNVCAQPDAAEHNRLCRWFYFVCACDNSENCLSACHVTLWCMKKSIFVEIQPPFHRSFYLFFRQEIIFYSRTSNISFITNIIFVSAFYMWSQLCLVFDKTVLS